MAAILAGRLRKPLDGGTVELREHRPNRTEGIVKLTDCWLFSALSHEAKPLKLRRGAIDNLLRFRSESG